MSIYIIYIYDYTFICIHIYTHIYTQTHTHTFWRCYFLFFIDWCCFYYFLRNSLVALLEALFARIFLDLRYRCALCTMSMIDPCHTLRTPTNIVGEIGLPRFQTECWAIPILCMPAHEHHDGYWMRQMNISNTISKDCNPICQIVPLHWHYIDMNIYSDTHLVVIAIAFFYSNNPSGKIPATFILHRYPHISDRLLIDFHDLTNTR